MEFISDKLGNLCEIVLGRTPSRNKSEYWGKGNTWVSISDLKEKVTSTTKEDITDLGAKMSRSRLISKGTLLMSFKLSVGKLTFTGKNLYTNEAIAALPIKEKKKIDKHYLYYALKNIPLVGGNQAAKGKTLNKSSLANLNIPFPKSLTDQKRIAKVLSNCETLINQRKESIELLDELLKSIFLEMFGDPVVNPKDWDIVTLSKFGKIDRGISKHRPRNAPHLLDGVHPLIQTGDVANSGTYIKDHSQTYSDIGLAQSKKWPVGTLCITIAANIAKTGILSFEACFPDSIVGFVVDKKEATNLYVHHLFSFFQRILEKNAPSAAQKNINLGILRSFKVPQPPIELQQEYDKIVLKIEEVRNYYQTSLQELENLYASISQKAFKGELDLSKIKGIEKSSSQDPFVIPDESFEDGKPRPDSNINSRGQEEDIEDTVLYNLDDEALETAVVYDGSEETDTIIDEEYDHLIQVSDFLENFLENSVDLDKKITLTVKQLAFLLKLSIKYIITYFKSKGTELKEGDLLEKKEIFLLAEHIEKEQIFSENTLQDKTFEKKESNDEDYVPSQEEHKNTGKFLNKKLVDFFTHNIGTYQNFVTDYMSRFENRDIWLDHEVTKKEIFKLLKGSNSKLIQFFDESDNTIKLKINEIN